MALILTIACISLMAALIYAARVIYVLPQPVPEVGIEAGRGGELLPVPMPPVPMPVPPVPVSTEQQIDFASIGFLCAMLIIAI
jgi:hypothetical protein